MAMTSAAGRLECGRDSGQLYDHLAAGTADAHERSCPYCQAAARDLAPLAAAAVSLAAEPVAAPAGLATAVMARVRREYRRRDLLSLPAPPPARLAITEHAAAAVLSAAAAAVPGVISRGCRFPEPGQPARVVLAVSLRYGLDLRQAARQVRAAVRQAARSQLGLATVVVDLVVEDVQLPQPA